MTHDRDDGNDHGQEDYYDEEEELGSEESANLSYNDSPASPSAKSVAKVLEAVNADGSLRKIIRARRSDFVHNLIYLDGKKFSFEGRDYLRPIYDRDDKRILLKTARQVEKCCNINSLVTTLNGSENKVKDLKVGDAIIGMGPDGIQVADKVVASQPNGLKPCKRIKTRLGSEQIVTFNHPFRKLLGWVEASSLSAGDKIASLRTQGIFGSISKPWAALLGVQVGDGYFYLSGKSWSLGLTQKNHEALSFIKSQIERCSFPYSDNYVDPRTGTTKITFSLRSEWAAILRSLDLDNKRAQEKVLPEEVFEWDEESTRELLRGLWLTDGHCKNVTECKVDLVFSSASRRLVRQVRLLLRKFGIITTLREYQPKGANHHKAYLIRVITRNSLQVFHDRIGPIPSKPFYIPETESNSNLDTLPKEMHEIINGARKSKGNYWKRDGFMSEGLRINKAYCPTFEKIASMNKFLEDESIQKVLDADIIWDEIVSIEDAGEQETWAIETETQTFVSDFIVNHNTTYLANNLTVTAVVKPYSKALYVSPSHSQTRQFSNEKLKPAIEKSPFIKKYFQDSAVSMQVFEKGFTNGAFIFLRSAFRSADRTRGISCATLTLDEIQDFQGSEIPVILECTSHFPDARVLMAGTPKSLNNPIEEYWKTTTQNEWIVKCHSCGHQNFLDETSIAPTEWYVKEKLPPGPVCKKCAKPIYPSQHGRWVSFNVNSPIQGYRIPQLMVPWICGLYDQWLKLLWKRDNYPLGQFYNEVLGISYESASKPITQDELIECCGDYSLWNPDNLGAHIQEAKRYQLTAGIDWGEGVDGSEKSPTGKTRNASYTVFSVGAYINQKVWKTFLIKRYMGKNTDPDFIVKDVSRIINQLGIHLAAVDWGHGWGVNNHLIRILGPRMIVQLQYLPKLKAKMKWDVVGARYHLQRNFIMSEYFFDLKQKFVMFPKWSEFQPFAKDILAIYSEYVEYRREIKYDHSSSTPDDAYHSLLYAKLASDIYLGKSRRFTFDIEGGIGEKGYINSFSS